MKENKNDLKVVKSKIIKMSKNSNTGSVKKEWNELSKKTLKVITRFLEEIHEKHMLINTMDFHIETLDVTPEDTQVQIDNFIGKDEEGRQVIMRVASCPADKMRVKVQMTFKRKNNAALMEFLEHHEELYKHTYKRRKTKNK